MRIQVWTYIFVMGLLWFYFTLLFYFTFTLKKLSCAFMMHQMKIRLNDRHHDNFVLFMYIVHSQQKVNKKNFKMLLITYAERIKGKSDCIRQTAWWFRSFLCARAHTHVFMMMLAFVPSLSVKCHQSVSTNFYTIAGGKVLLYTLLLRGHEGSTNHVYS